MVQSVPRPAARGRVASALFGASAVGAVAAACGPEAKEAGRSACDGVELLVAASDYSSSVVCGAPTCVAGPDTSGADLGGDPQLASSNGRAFFLARSYDLVFELDPLCGVPRARFGVKDAAVALGVSAPANPHDVAAAPDGTAWVALYNVPRIALVKDGALVGTVDLSSYDPDGNPQAESIRIVDVGGSPKAFVALERLDDRDKLRSTQPSFVLRIDVATRGVEQVIELEGRNPFNPMSEHEGALYLAEPGNFDAANEALAGVERLDTRAGTSRLLVREEDLGGSVAEIAVTEGCGAAIVAGPERDVNPTSLVTFDPESGRVFARADAPVLGPTPGYDLQGLAWRGAFLYVGDRRPGASGYPVHVLERVGGRCELRPVARSLALPLPPVALRPAP